MSLSGLAVKFLFFIVIYVLSADCQELSIDGGSESCSCEKQPNLGRSFVVLVANVSSMPDLKSTYVCHFSLNSPS